MRGVRGARPTPDATTSTRGKPGACRTRTTSNAPAQPWPECFISEAHVEPDVLRIAQLFAIIGMFAAGMVGLARLAKFAFREPKKTPPFVPGVDEARFARLENAVETIAIEVERISEAQRFTTKLL